ncbi:M36 family metallopeptidase [Fodinibius salsisoli]|uniref:M36 family metallopeptidase n=1 Tax=Fodinibius salsisoli TaxID=2820877 RepID=A0ABT3PN75_9BACT|nr:M36 family metallopeptidase [Fodinibius salsisoli]MCW9707386.1 M36 family metallopeptidase [Fodinibius salsisoli]
MKRIISLYTLLLFLLVSCDSTVSDLNSDQLSSSRSEKVAQISPGTPPIVADSIRKAVWQQFTTQNGSDWQIRWDKDTGRAASIFSGVTQETYSGDAKQAARSFISRYGVLFGMSNIDKLEYKKMRRHRGVRHVTFQQTVENIPVYEAEFKVHLRQDGRVDMVNGTYYPDIEVSTSPSVTKSQAIRTAEEDFNIENSTALETTSELIVYPEDDQFYLAWKLTLFSEQPAINYFYIVDAHSGQVLYRLNQLTNITGVGDVYSTHPGLSSVGQGLFYRLTGNERLQGTYAHIVNDASAEAQSSIHSFKYGTGSTHFDEANLYFHIDNFRHNFIENIDDGSLGFTQIRAHAHTPIQDINDDGYLDPNAWFNRSNQNLYFNDAYAPLGTEDFAKEDKVIYHEYGHAVIFDIESGIRSEFSEEGAISEGAPDYWAGSFTVRSIIGDYAFPPLAQRDMANPEIDSYLDYQNRQDYPNVDSHDGGEFFSAILWDLRNTISASDVDFLVYDALYRVTGDPNFLGFRDAMIAADEAAFNGENKYDIQDTFAEWGVGEPAPLYTSISGPVIIDAGETETYTASSSRGSGSYSYVWYEKPIGSSNWSNIGTGSSISMTGTEDIELKVEATDNQNSDKTGVALMLVKVNGGDKPDPF